MNTFNVHPFEVGDKVLLCTKGPENPAWYTPRIERGRIYVIRETLFSDIGDDEEKPAVRLVGVFGDICWNGKERTLLASHFVSLAKYRANLAAARRAREGLSLAFMPDPSPEPQSASLVGSKKRPRRVSPNASLAICGGERETPEARAAAVETMLMLVNERKRLAARRRELEESSKRARTGHQLAATHECTILDARLAWLDQQLKAGIPIAGTSLVVKPA